MSASFALHLHLRQAYLTEYCCHRSGFCIPGFPDETDVIAAFITAERFFGSFHNVVGKCCQYLFHKFSKKQRQHLLEGSDNRVDLAIRYINALFNSETMIGFHKSSFRNHFSFFYFFSKVNSYFIMKSSLCQLFHPGLQNVTRPFFSYRSFSLTFHWKSLIFEPTYIQ